PLPPPPAPCPYTTLFRSHRHRPVAHAAHHHPLEHRLAPHGRVALGPQITVAGALNRRLGRGGGGRGRGIDRRLRALGARSARRRDRKSTRLNSSHEWNSY